MAATQRASLGRPRALAALLAVYARVTTATGRLGPDELMRPSRCAGWTASDVLYHQLLHARRALIASASRRPTPRLPTWTTSAPGARRPARHAAARAVGRRQLRTQGHRRVPVTPAARTEIGPLADRLPLFGEQA